mgnify:CR=1 FL=1
MKLPYWLEGLIRPRVVVRVLQAAGDVYRWAGEAVEADAKEPPARPTRFWAVELPEDLVLRLSLSLPPELADSEVLAAVELAVMTASPFAEADTVWGCWHEQRQDGNMTHIALTSRQHIQDWLANLGSRVSDAEAPEIWAPAENGRPIVFRGYGEMRRLSLGGRDAAWSLLLAGTAVLLGTAMALTPTLQLRLKAIDALQAFDQLRVAAKPDIQRRDAIARSAEQVSALSDVVATTVDPIAVLDFLTKVVPEDTSLLSVRIQGKTATLNGQTSNAATLMKVLGSQPGVREVKSPNAATRAPGATREVFTIDVTLGDPEPVAGAVATPGAKP